MKLKRYVDHFFFLQPVTCRIYAVAVCLVAFYIAEAHPAQGVVLVVLLAGTAWAAQGEVIQLAQVGVPALQHQWLIGQPSPTSHAKFCVPPAQGNKPTFASGNAICACSSTIRMSQAPENVLPSDITKMRNLGIQVCLGHTNAPIPKDHGY